MGNQLDVIHESVLRNWDKMEGWLKTEADARDRYAELARRAKRKDDPLAGDTLEETLKLVPEFTPAWVETVRLGPGRTRRALRFLKTASGPSNGGGSALGRHGCTGARGGPGLSWRHGSCTGRASSQKRGNWRLPANATLKADPAVSIILGLHAWRKAGHMPSGLEQTLYDATQQPLLIANLHRAFRRGRGRGVLARRAVGGQRQ